MKTIREIVDAAISKLHLTGSIKAEIRESMEMNLYRKLLDAMLAMPVQEAVGCHACHAGCSYIESARLR